MNRTEKIEIALWFIVFISLIVGWHFADKAEKRERLAWVYQALEKGWSITTEDARLMHEAEGNPMP